MAIPTRRTKAGAAGRAAVPRMNRDRVKQRAVENSKTSGGNSTVNTPYDYFKPVKGTQVIRILPYIVTDKNHPDRVPAGELWYRRPMKIHFGVGPEEKARICPTIMGKRCPICEYALERRRSGDATDEELRQLKAKDRDLFLVVDPSAPENIMSWEVSFHNFTKQLNREVNENPDELAGFADLVDGMDLKVRFDEASMGSTKFLEANRIDFIPRRKPADPTILEELPSLDDCLMVLGYKELEAEFLGIPVEEDEADAPDDAPDEEQPQPPMYAQDDESEPEEEPEEEEEEPEPPPRPARKALPVKPARKAAAAQPARPARKAAPAPAEGECPAGGKWGADCNALDECDTCDIWEDCQEEFNRLAAARRKKRG